MSHTSYQYFCAYVYCLCKSPKSILKYQLYCNMHNKNIDIDLLIKIIYLSKIHYE